jgi:putative acetyltransferase
MTGYLVREAAPADAGGYIRLMKAILRENPPVDTPYSASEFDPAPLAMAARIGEYPETGNSLFLAAFEGRNHALIGSLTCKGGTLHADAHVTELGVYVAKDWRDRGVGGALMAQAMAWATAHALVRRVQLEVMSSNARAIRLYERFGFAREGVRRHAYRRSGQYSDMIIMAWLAPE